MVTSLSSWRPRRVLSILVFSTIALIIYYTITVRESWRALPLEKIGFGEEKSDVDDWEYTEEEEIAKGRYTNGTTTTTQGGFQNVSPGSAIFQPGIVKPAGEPYTKMLVIPRTKAENTTWVDDAFADVPSIHMTVYVADDPSAPLHPPTNKGHEVMVYLSYIIDHYDALSDISLFMHSHRHAWHNDELLDRDAVQMIARLSAARVVRDGFMNLRCHWYPGCPTWLHPGAVAEDGNKKEEAVFARAWAELFPGTAVPSVVAGTCCAQFAVSRERIRAVPKKRYVALREWVINTPIRDSISGRIWEYLWHYLFTGREVYCPLEHVCYCDGFGICFGGEQQYNAWWEKEWERRRYEEELKTWKEGKTVVDGKEVTVVPEPGKDVELQKKIADLDAWLRTEKERAIHQGDDPRNRASEAGREWKPGDGF